VHDDIAARLLRLNLEFYQTFAEPFSETRGRVQPGVLRALKDLPAGSSVLDLGCGNGELARELARQGHGGSYLGVDASPELLAKAAARSPSVRFLRADLSAASWADDLGGPFDRIYAFAVLHHFPGSRLRLGFALQAGGLLGDAGRLVLSTWNFQASERLRARIVPWERLGLNPGEVDPGDYLLDWRRGGGGLRYVHLFDEAELGRLAAEAGLVVADTYLSDGEGGRLGLYQVWAREHDERDGVVVAT
jgi:SAM-dependent methyltransferase